MFKGEIDGLFMDEVDQFALELIIHVLGDLHVQLFSGIVLYQLISVACRVLRIQPARNLLREQIKLDSDVFQCGIKSRQLQNAV